MCYFSSDKLLVAALTILTFSAPAFSQQQTPPETPTANDSASLPQTSTPLPPDLPQRNRPALQVVPQAVTSTFVPAKVPLAWRQKALKLSLDKFKPAADATNATPLLRSFAANYSDTIAALATACSASGFKVEHINSNAGEILATNNDNNSRLIFSIWEQPEGKTWISAGVDRGGTAAAKAATLIMDGTGTTIGKRGRI